MYVKYKICAFSLVCEESWQVLLCGDCWTQWPSYKHSNRPCQHSVYFMPHCMMYYIVWYINAFFLKFSKRISCSKMCDALIILLGFKREANIEWNARSVLETSNALTVLEHATCLHAIIEDSVVPMDISVTCHMNMIAAKFWNWKIRALTNWWNGPGWFNVTMSWTPVFYVISETFSWFRRNF